jgi:choice-of-anchor B domain-containing protein
MRFPTILLLFLTGLRSFAQTPCTNGFSDGYPCEDIQLVSFVNAISLNAEPKNGVYLNDIWGWTDSTTNTEYALVGMANGTAFVNLKDPLNPVFQGWLPEHNSELLNARVYHDSLGAKSIWRDIKVYKNHAFIISEDPGHGIQIFDLTSLRIPSENKQYSETAHYAGIGSAHNIAINEETGFAYVVGARSNPGISDCVGGGLHIVDIREPSNPVFAGCFDDDGYTHDVQCVIYQGTDIDYQGKEICFASNVEVVSLVDVSDKDSPVLISKAAYPDDAYTHQGWLTPDHRYFVANDELDEISGTTKKTRTLLFDMQDIDNPNYIGSYLHQENTIDHNLYINERYVYQSNYTAGFRVLSYDSITNGDLESIAFFDTYPNNNDQTFKGTWSNYPFFQSGIIVATDIDKGLFILGPQYEPYFLSQPDALISYFERSEIKIEVNIGGQPADLRWIGVTESGDSIVIKNSESVFGVDSLLLKKEYNRYDQVFIELIAENGMRFYSLPARFTDEAIQPVGINNQILSEGKIYPNPTNDRLYYSNWKDFISAQIYSVSGKLIGKSVTKKNSLPFVSTENLKAGYYLIRFQHLNGAIETYSFQKL